MYSAAIDDGIFRIFQIDENKAKVLAKGVFHRKYKVSKTFHGRDIFGLVAASLENKYTLDFMGKITTINEKLDIRPNNKDINNKGIVVDIDNYGNIITNIYNDKLLEMALKNTKENNRITKKKIKLILGTKSKEINMYPYYDLAKKNEIFGLINSQGVLEIAKKQSSANKSLKLKIGDKVQIYI